MWDPASQPGKPRRSLLNRIRIPEAFSAEDASAMCDVVWAALARAGIRRNDRSTWTTARPIHLQYLKSDPVFQAIGSARTIGAIDEVLEGNRGKERVTGVPSSCNSLLDATGMCHTQAGTLTAITRGGCYLPVA